MDLTSTYMGLRLKNPLIASASPLNGELDAIRRLEDRGAAAVVLPSIFEEQLRAEEEAAAFFTGGGAECSAEAPSHVPARGVQYTVGVERYLELIRRAVDAVDIPIIASLNGTTEAGWLRYAKSIEQAGAHALELNIYFIPADIVTMGREVEQRYLAIVRAVKREIGIPVAVKLGPYFSAMGSMAKELSDAGADGLVLFNRFYQPDIDLAHMRLVTDLRLSERYEMRLPLLWIAVLAGRIAPSLAATTGVERADDVIKYLLVGADVVMTTSSLLRHGIDHIGRLLNGVRGWLEAREFSGLDQIRGMMSHRRVPDPAAFERHNYIRMLDSWQKPPEWA
jgi:dihydroorotate dehydrogenase (fumarate)